MYCYSINNTNIQQIDVWTVYPARHDVNVLCMQIKGEIAMSIQFNLTILAGKKRERQRDDREGESVRIGSMERE